jgi:hypothetical protein
MKITNVITSAIVAILCVGAVTIFGAVTAPTFPDKPNELPKPEQYLKRFKHGELDLTKSVIVKELKALGVTRIHHHYVSRPWWVGPDYAEVTYRGNVVNVDEDAFHGMYVAEALIDLSEDPPMVYLQSLPEDARSADKHVSAVNALLYDIKYGIQKRETNEKYKRDGTF